MARQQNLPRWKPPSAMPTSCGPTFGVTPPWEAGGEPNGKGWPDCCGFVVLPEAQSQWLILRHGFIVVAPDMEPPTHCVADQEVSARRRTCSSEKVAISHLRGPSFQTVPGRTDALLQQLFCGTQRCPPRCIQLPALCKLLLTAFSNVFCIVVQVRVCLRVEARFLFSPCSCLRSRDRTTQLATPHARCAPLFFFFEACWAPVSCVALARRTFGFC